MTLNINLSLATRLNCIAGDKMKSPGVYFHDLSLKRKKIISNKPNVHTLKFMFVLFSAGCMKICDNMK